MPETENKQFFEILEKLRSYIPGVAIPIYALITELIKTSNQSDSIKFSLSLASIIVTAVVVFILASQAKAQKDAKDGKYKMKVITKEAFISISAFLTWAYYLGEPFIYLKIHNPLVGIIAVILVILVFGLIEKLSDPNMIGLELTKHTPMPDNKEQPTDRVC